MMMRELLKLRLTRVFLVFLSALLVVTPVFGLSASDEEKFAQNDLLFYDPEGSGDPCYGGFTNVCGDTAVEKIWSGLIQAGFTPEQAAGALGNISHEGGMNPAQWELPYSTTFDYYNNDAGVNGSGGGVGLIQWSFGRRINVLNYIRSNAPHLMKYFEDWQTYSSGYVSGDEFIAKASEEDANALFALEIKFLHEEMTNNNAYKKVFEQTTVENAAWIFLTHVERPRGISVDTTLAQAKATRPERFADAEKYYNELKNFSCESSTSGGGSGGAAVSTDGSNVTIIGDSLTERSKADLLALMPNADINSDVGRSFSTGVSVASTMSLRDIVVFALGTNSAGLTSDQVNQALTTIGSDKTIVLTMNYGTESSGLDFSGNNQLFSEAATANANVKIADWAAIAGENPDENMDADGYHQSIPVGAKLFADMIYNAVSGMGNIGNGCGPGGSFAQLVLAYAWPEYHSAPFFDMMPDYEAVVAKRIDEGLYVGGGIHPGIDCGGWVTTLMQESGYAPGYGGGGNTTIQEPWVQNNGWTRLNPGGEDVDTSLLQAGDVAFTPGHTFVFVGEIPGFDSVIASASYSTSGASWRTPMAGRESLTGGVRWYRKGAV